MKFCQEENFWSKLSVRGGSAFGRKKPILALAPMAGITDSAFRQICREFGADVVYTEMVSADGLYHNSKKTLEFLKFSQSEKPVVIQLFGKEPEKFTKAARICEGAGFDGIDINFGCPARKVVAHGGGVTLMRDLKKCREIIEAVMAGTKLPVSVKLRASILFFPPFIGGEQEGGNVLTPPALRAASPYKGEAKIVTALDFIRYMKDLPLAAVMIHGRRYEDYFSGPIDYQIIKAVKNEFSESALGGQGVVLANGGINTPQDAKEMLDKTGADGLGLARGARGRPWLFKQIKDYLNSDKFQDLTIKQIQRVMLHHARLVFQTKNQHGIIELRKHLAWYITGWPKAKTIRDNLVRAEKISEIQQILTNYNQRY